MNTTDFILENLSGIISSENSLNTLMDMVKDMGLELSGVQRIA